MSQDTSIQVPEPRNRLEALWNWLGFHTPTQRKAYNQEWDARNHEARLRRLAENGGLDPLNDTDYMTLQIRRHRAEEEAKFRAKTIRTLSRQILAAQCPNHSRHQLHTPDDVKLAIEQATRIYDLTHAARVETILP